MSSPRMTTETMSASDVERHFASVLDRVAQKATRVVVETSGVAVAAIIPADELARLDRLDAERAERFKVIDEMRAAFADVSPEEIEREAERTLAAVRAEMRA